MAFELRSHLKKSAAVVDPINPLVTFVCLLTLAVSARASNPELDRDPCKISFGLSIGGSSLGSPAKFLAAGQNPKSRLVPEWPGRHGSTKETPDYVNMLEHFTPQLSAQPNGTSEIRIGKVEGLKGPEYTIEGMVRGAEGQAAYAEVAWPIETARDPSHDGNWGQIIFGERQSSTDWARWYVADSYLYFSSMCLAPEVNPYLKSGGSSRRLTNAEMSLSQVLGKVYQDPETKVYTPMNRDTIGLTFYGKSLGAAPQQAIMVIETFETRRLSQELQKRVTWQAKFTAHPKISKIGINYGEFQLIADGQPLDLNDKPTLTDSDMVSVGFLWNQDLFGTANRSVDGHFGVALSPSIDFFSFVPGLDRMFEAPPHPPIYGARRRQLSFPANLVEELILPYMRETSDTRDKLVQKFSEALRRSYEDREAHLRAVKIVMQAIRERSNAPINTAFQELHEQMYTDYASQEIIKDLGFHDGGVQGVRGYELPNIQFSVGKELNGLVDLLAGILMPIRIGEIPVEIGPFAKVHGAYSHHAQILALMFGLKTNIDRLLFVTLIKEITGPVNAWVIWTGLFDAPGVGPDSPQYWRDLIDEELRGSDR